MRNISLNDINQNYYEIANMCKDTAEPIFLSGNGDGDLPGFRTFSASPR